MTRTDALVYWILGDCTCGQEYKEREMTSPRCARCQNEDEAREALLLAFEYGYDSHCSVDARPPVEHNREGLAKLRAWVEQKTMEIP